MKSIKETNDPTPVTFKLSAALREKAAATAEDEGLLLSGFIRKALEIYSGFGPMVRGKIHELSELHGLSEARIINSILVRYIADSMAWDKKHPDDPLMTPEFMKSSKGPLDEDRLLEFLINDRISDLEDDQQMKDLNDRYIAFITKAPAI